MALSFIKKVFTFGKPAEEPVPEAVERSWSRARATKICQLLTIQFLPRRWTRLADLRPISMKL